MSLIRKAYPSDVSDDEWALVAPYPTLVREDAGQREHRLREVFNGLSYVVKTGAPWRWMPNDLPPWAAVYQQAQRWHAAGCFERLAEDLRAVLRLAAGRKADPSAVTSETPAAAAREHGIALEVVKLPEAKRGFVLLPRRWVVERSFAWATRFRRLVTDYERYASTLANLHIVAFVCLMPKKASLLPADP